MNFRGYEDLRPFGCFTLMEIGFMSLYSNLAIGRRERDALRAASHLRLSEAQAAVSAVVSRCEGWSLMDRSAVLAGRDMCSAVAVMSAAVTEHSTLSHSSRHNRNSRTHVTPSQYIRSWIARMYWLGVKCVRLLRLCLLL